MERIVRALAATAMLACATLAGGQSAHACTTFVMKGDRCLLFGRNLDFFMKDGRLMTNQRGVSKYALLLGAGKPARWVSKYGSVTFNQVGKEYPMGGMNEAGLVVENMSLEGTEFPQPDERPALSELQWIQYQLDNCASVREVIATDGAIRIERPGQPIHYLVADREGNVAAIEFLGGRMVCHTGDALPVRVLTNNTYDESLSYLRRHAGFGGREKLARSVEPLDRFATAASMLERRGAVRRGTAVRRSFGILDAVAYPEGTVWSIVYDVKGRRIHFRTIDGRAIRRLDLDDIDFDCSHPARLLDLAAPLEGDVAAALVDYRMELNRELVKGTLARYREAKFVEIPESAQEYLARYPESFTCGSGAR